MEIAVRAFHIHRHLLELTLEQRLGERPVRHLADEERHLTAAIAIRRIGKRIIAGPLNARHLQIRVLPGHELDRPIERDGDLDDVVGQRLGRRDFAGERLHSRRIQRLTLDFHLGQRIFRNGLTGQDETGSDFLLRQRVAEVGQR